MSESAMRGQSVKATAGLMTLPYETASQIHNYPDVDSIRSLRLTCSKNNVIASPFLIRAAWISPRCEDWIILQSISRHPVFSKCVREIRYDGTHYRSDLEDFEAFKIRATKFVLLFQGTRLSFDLTPSELYLSHKKWTNVYMKQCELRSQTTRESEDVMRLAHTLPQLPNVTSFVFSDLRWESLLEKLQRQCKHSVAYFQSRSLQLKSAVILYQRKLLSSGQMWPAAEWNTDRSWELYRGFWVFPQAAFILDMKRLQSFSLLL